MTSTKFAVSRPEAVEQRTTLEDLETMLEEMLAETGGPATAAETRAARRSLRSLDALQRRDSAELGCEAQAGSALRGCFHRRAPAS